MNSIDHATSAPVASVVNRPAIGAAEVESLRRIAVGLASPGVDPDDLVQDAIERALRSWDSFAAGTNLIAWVRTIMQRLAIDAWRRRNRRNHVPLPDSLASPEVAETAPARESWKQFELSDVCQAVGALGEPLRSTFRMHALEGRSYLEISRMLGIPVSTVGTRMRRARLRLRALLESRPRPRPEVEVPVTALCSRRPAPPLPLPVSLEELRSARYLRVAA